ncbi:transglutaminase domain protein [Catenulispora acidiphila DSM 44928]|uniref:Transglutaminase domain protein n=1 Tax=Catenulispora acidiphila (strain DSM 44928 / JCM 14897 / NBRC 102108 / NRRL B-24433 / ID139908) TaxID=479433 RepID=C7PYL8_CATAD|nr:transglutaminase domain-containing protein [Catenulispora acidiphila]ACU77340.1 transglutaminase domain protein [Catenulispora acidiphila DSM 44928]
MTSRSTISRPTASRPTPPGPTPPRPITSRPTSQRRNLRILLVVPTALLCAIAGISLRGAFDVGDIVPECLLATAVPSGIVALAAAATATARRARGFELFALGGALLTWLTVLPAASIGLAGWRGGDHQSVTNFLSVLRTAVTDGARQLLLTTSPARPTAVLLTTAGTCLWWAAAWAAICAIRGASPLAVLLPPTILLGLGTAASAGAGDPKTILTAALFLVIAVLFVGLDQATRGNPADAVVIRNRSARPWAAAIRTAPFFATVTALTLLTASLAPHLPGLPQRRPWDPRTLIAPAQQVYDETDPLTQAVAWLKESTPSPLFTLTTSDANQRLRWQVLDTYDGRHWSTSAEYRVAGKTLPTPAALWDPAGPTHSVTETVRLQDLSSVFLPATGRVRSVSGTDVRVSSDLGMIATSDGHVASPSLSYKVDTTVPDFSNASRLSNAQQSTDTALQPFEQLPPQVPDDLTAFAGTAAVGNTPFDQMNALATAVRGAFGYAPDSAAGQSLGRLSALVSYGKDQSRHVGGSADAFASLFAVTARQAGFPARLVVGFAPGTQSGAAGAYSVTSQDVRVWPEVYFAGVGWVPFYDAVPDGKGTTGDVNPVQEQASTVPTSETPTSQASQSAVPYTGPSVRLNNPSPQHKAPLVLLIAGVAVALIIAAVCALLVVALVSRRRRLATRRGDPDPRRRTQWAWLESLDALGIDGRTTTTPLELALRAGAPLGADGAEPIKQLAGLAEVAAYAPLAPDADQAEQAWKCADQIRVLSRRQTPRRVRAMRLLRPPSKARRH